MLKDPTYREGSKLPYLGKNYPLKIVNNQKIKRIRLNLLMEKNF
jgi:hypothetical protein